MRCARAPHASPTMAWAALVLGSLVALGSLAAVWAPAALARGADSGPTAADFDGVVSAWRARDAKRVASFVPADARLVLYLDGSGGGPVTGRASRDNAETILTDYFDGLKGVTLVDVTPADSRLTSRVYDYTYKPKDGDRKTTSLTFTLRALSQGGYALLEVSERKRPS